MNSLNFQFARFEKFCGDVSSYVMNEIGVTRAVCFRELSTNNGIIAFAGRWAAMVINMHHRAPGVWKTIRESLANEINE